ncbi:MAG: hypothetical protein KBS54_03695 [Synergistaceae bacterium]|nr:hypothetical protein [Candidatus Equadaptatus faecalis]
MKSEKCKVQSEKCKMQNAKCKMQNAKCKMQSEKQKNLCLAAWSAAEVQHPAAFASEVSY